MVFLELKNSKSRVKLYNKTLASRERNFNRNMKHSDSKFNRSYLITDIEELKRYAFNKSKGYMSEDEKKMSYEQWLTYYEQISNNETALIASFQANSDNLMQSLSISGMGIYNCDQIRRINNPIEVYADYKSSTTDKKLYIMNTLVIDKKRNSVFQFTGYNGYSPSNIVISGDSKSSQILIAVKADGGLAIYTEEDFKNVELKNKKKHQFVVNEIDTSFTTVDDLRKIIGL